jgi:hypothetical protein
MDTPKTDEIWVEHRGTLAEYFEKLLEHSRQLERELAEAQNMINLLRESHDVVTKQFQKVDAELADHHSTTPETATAFARIAERNTDMRATGTEKRVCDDIASRQEIGIRKYKTTVEQNPLSLRQWLHHAYEETLDQAIYLKRAIEEIDTTTIKSIPPKPTTPNL